MNNIKDLITEEDKRLVRLLGDMFNKPRYVREIYSELSIAISIKNITIYADPELMFSIRPFGRFREDHVPLMILHWMTGFNPVEMASL